MTDMIVSPARTGLFSHRDFTLFWVSQSISGLGDQLTVIALAALVWQISGSSLLTALVVIVSTIPHALFGFFAWTIADTLGRRRTLVICDLTRAMCIGLIPAVIAFRMPLASVFVLVL